MQALRALEGVQRAAAEGPPDPVVAEIARPAIAEVVAERDQRPLNVGGRLHAMHQAGCQKVGRGTNRQNGRCEGAITVPDSVPPERQT